MIIFLLFYLFLSLMQLYIQSKGSRISVHDNHFIVEVEDQLPKRIPVGKVNCMYLHRSVVLTAEVAFAAVANEVDVQFVDRNGQPVARLWSNRFGSISLIRKQQLVFSQHTDAIAWVRQLLADKIEQSIALLLSVQGLSGDVWTTPAIVRLEDLKGRIKAVEAEDMTAAGLRLRPIEGAASKVYFQTLNQLLPPQYRFEKRSQHPGLDMFNAMLNYTYGILYGRIEKALIKAGIDPHVGIFHRDDYNKPVLTYDVIERFRCWAEWVVVRLCQQEVIFQEFFDIENGAFFLNTYGKRIVVQAFEDYMSEVVHWNDLQRSRNTHLELAMQQLAAFFKQWASA